MKKPSPKEEILIDRAWLKGPVASGLGELQLAGFLSDTSRIEPSSMRVLGSYALVLVTEGEGYYCDDRGVSCDLKAGDVIVVFPDVPHAYGPEDKDTVEGGTVYWKQIYYVFAGPVFDLMRERGILSETRPVWRLGAVDYWRGQLEGVLAGEALHGAGGALRGVGRFMHVLTEMSSAALDAAQPARVAWLDKALRLLGDRSASGWLSPHDVAHETGLNYDNFRKQFSAQTGESPGTYQKRRRIEWACAALYHGGAGFKEIAAELGFCDEFHFSKVFKQVTGMTPSAYRKKMRG